MAKTDLTGKVITIDGVDYKLVAVEKTDKRNKVNRRYGNAYRYRAAGVQSLRKEWLSVPIGRGKV